MYICTALKFSYVFLLFVTIENKTYVNILEKSERDKDREAKKGRTKWGDK